MTASNREEQIPNLGTPPRARRRPRPRKSGCFTIRIAEQNNCGTIGLLSLQKTQAHRGRRTTTRTSANFGICVKLLGKTGKSLGSDSARVRSQKQQREVSETYIAGRAGAHPYRRQRSGSVLSLQRCIRFPTTA